MRGVPSRRPLAALASLGALLALAGGLAVPGVSAAPLWLPAVQATAVVATPFPAGPTRGLRLEDLPPGFQQRSLLRQQLTLADRSLEAEITTFEREPTLANLLAGPTTIVSVVVAAPSGEEVGALLPALGAALQNGGGEVQQNPAPAGLGEEGLAYRLTRSRQGFSLTGQVLAWRRGATLAVVEVVGLAELNDGAEARRLSALLDARLESRPAG